MQGSSFPKTVFKTSDRERNIQASKIKSKTKLNAILRKQLILNDNPVAISVCTGFLTEDENHESNFSGSSGLEQDCDDTKKHVFIVMP